MPFGLRTRVALASLTTLYRETCKNGWIDRFAVWVVHSGGPKKIQVQSYLPGGANVPVVKYSNILPWSVQKWLNRSICCLVCGLLFVRWCQYALIGAHKGATWRIRLNRPSAAAMRPYVKLLWPLVTFSCSDIFSTTKRKSIMLFM